MRERGKREYNGKQSLMRENNKQIELSSLVFDRERERERGLAHSSLSLPSLVSKLNY